MSGQGSVWPGKCLAREVSGQGSVWSGKCLVREVSGRGSVWSGKCPSGEVSVGGSVRIPKKAVKLVITSPRFSHFLPIFFLTINYPFWDILYPRKTKSIFTSNDIKSNKAKRILHIVYCGFNTDVPVEANGPSRRILTRKNTASNKKRKNAIKPKLPAATTASSLIKNSPIKTEDDIMCIIEPSPQQNVHTTLLNIISGRR